MVLYNKKITLTRIGILASFVGSIFWIYSVLTTNIWWIDPSYKFGLFQVLPVWFWVGFFLNLIGFFLTAKSRSYFVFVCQLLLLVFMIWGTPNIIQANARIIDTWQLFATAKTVIDSGAITVTGQITHFYLQYPSSFTFIVEILAVTGIPAELFLKVFPLISSSFFIFGFWTFIRQKVANGIYLRATITAIIFLDVWLSFHFSPQTFALMLFPLILFSLEKQGLHWSAISLILFTSSVLFHPTLPAIMLGILTITYILLRLFKQRVTFGSKLAFFGFLWVGWFAFTASELVTQNIANAFKRFVLLSLYGFQATSQLSRASGDVASLVRLLTIGLILFFAIIIVVLQRKDRWFFAQSAGWFIGCLIFFVVDLSAFSGSFGNRSLMIISLVLPVIVIGQIEKIKKTRKLKSAFMLAFVLLLLPNFSTLYFAENLNIISNSNLATCSFLNQNLVVTIPDRIVSGGISPLYYYNTSAEWNYWFGGLNVSDNIHKNEVLIYNEYVLSAKTMPLAIESMIELYVTCNQQFGINQVYNNGKFLVFYVQESS